MQQVFSGRVTWLSSLLKETTDAQLFAQSEHAPDQTELQPQHLQCSNDLSPAWAIMPVFHAVSRAEGPYQQNWVIGLKSAPTPPVTCVSVTSFQPRSRSF